MKYLLDTNIVLLYARANSIADKIEKDLNLFSDPTALAVSIVMVGELNSFAKQRNYGKRRLAQVRDLLHTLSILDVNGPETIDLYGTIDAYSQGNLKDNPSPFSARNMGKNDLWIAATAAFHGLTLVTTDKDFQHLDGVFLNVLYVDQAKYK